MNTLGRRLRVSLFGESHGPGVGALVDGVPPGLPVDPAAVQARLDQRRPGTGPLVSARREPDTVQLLSGIHDGHTTGAPLALWIPNEDARPNDYGDARRLPRPGHADLVEHLWSHGHNDPRGGGHRSGRLTAPLVAAAAVMEPLLAQHGITVGAHLLHVAGLPRPPLDEPPPAAELQAAVAGSPVHSALGADPFVAAIEAARRDGDSLGGTIAWRADGVPALLGNPWADGADSLLAHALAAIPAVRGTSIGHGMDAADMRGSTHNDPYTTTDGNVVPTTNHAGGILGGRTTGAPLWGHVAFKPASSIARAQQTVDLETMEPAELRVRGRHDPCIAVRAVPVVRAVVELVVGDLLVGPS